jgi:CelD/BcsL family acetyltransferase involved in cellulose biosynthesis
VELLTSPPEFYALENEWKSLVRISSTGTVFLAWEWMSTWWESFGEGSQLRVFTLRENDKRQLVGVAPFVLRKLPYSQRPLYRELSFLGGAMVAPDHLDLLIKAGFEERGISAIVDETETHRRGWDVIRLDAMASQSSMLHLLLGRTGWKTMMVWESTCPFIGLPYTWEEYHSTLDAKLRYNLRSRARRLERAGRGQISYQRVRHEHELPDAMATLFHLHRLSRRTKGDAGAFSTPAIAGFHQRIARLFLANDWLRLYFLKVGEQAIATLYCFRYGDVVYFYQTGYDTAWSRYGPGSAILAHAIRASIEEGAREFDFMRGTEPYKFQWTSQTRRDLRVRLASTKRGRLVVETHRVARAGRARFRAWRSSTFSGRG